MQVSQSVSNREGDGSASTTQHAKHPASQHASIEVERIDEPTRRRCHPPFQGNKEAQGWAIDSIPRGILVVGPAVYLATALIKLAREEAGCPTDPPEGEVKVPECNNKVYGIKPSSIITFYTLIVGLSASVCLPLVGAIIDHTKYRRDIGYITAILMTVFSFGEIFLSKKTWFAVAILHVFVTVSLHMHNLVILAYLPELTDDEATLTRWTAWFSVASFLAMALYLIIMVGVIAALGLQDDEVAAARISQSATVVIATICFGYAWARCFNARPAFQMIPEGRNLVTAGFRKIYNTVVHMRSTNAPLLWFLLSTALSEAGLNGVLTIGITFMVEHLHFSTTENGIAALCLLLGSVPGAAITVYLSQKFNPRRSLQICLLFFIANTVVAALVLSGPGQQIATYLFSAGWGIAAGWKYPADRTVYCSIIPPGQDAELMGIFIFATQCLSWLPPLVFILLNEVGVPMQVNLSMLAIYYLGSFVALLMMGNYEDACVKAKQGGRETHGAEEIGEDQEDSSSPTIENSVTQDNFVDECPT